MIKLWFCAIHFPVARLLQSSEKKNLEQHSIIANNTVSSYAVGWSMNFLIPSPRDEDLAPLIEVADSYCSTDLTFLDWWYVSAHQNGSVFSLHIVMISP